MILYHATASVETLQRILQDGFRDAGGTYGTGQRWEGVWLSDRRLSGGNGGLSGTEPCLRLDIPEDVVTEFEWVGEGHADTYREWLVPAEIVNRYRREVEDE